MIAALRAYFTYDLIIHLIIFQFLLIMITFWNIWLTRRIRKPFQQEDPPKVSILVPARNEEVNIQACIESLLLQDYKDYEVLVLDDQSTDQTRPILDQIAEMNPMLKVLKGKHNPEGQTGKNWACTQLAEQASGSVYFFTDADTIHDPQTLSTAIGALEYSQADLITGYPKQIVETWGEKLLVPFFSWVVLTFFPLGLAYRLPWPIFTNAVGQMILIRRDAYKAIGGHAAFKTSIVDDLSLAREVHRSGRRWRVMHAADLISCRMYRNNKEALEGFTKNLFSAFEFRLIPYLFSFLWLGLMFLEPLGLLILQIGGLAVTTPIWIPAISVCLSVLVWIIPYINLGIPAWLALIYPLTILANGFTALRSLWLSMTGKLSWKGRQIQPGNWRLI